MLENENMLENEKPGKPNETKSEKFKRIAENRVEKAIAAILNLKNLSNTNNYEYDQKLVDMMFGNIEATLAEVKAMFQPKASIERKPFRFGDESASGLENNDDN